MRQLNWLGSEIISEYTSLRSYLSSTNDVRKRCVCRSDEGTMIEVHFSVPHMSSRLQQRQKSLLLLLSKVQTVNILSNFMMRKYTKCSEGQNKSNKINKDVSALVVLVCVIKVDPWWILCVLLEKQLPKASVSCCEELLSILYCCCAYALPVASFCTSVYKVSNRRSRKCCTRLADCLNHQEATSLWHGTNHLFCWVLIQGHIRCKYKYQGFLQAGNSWMYAQVIVNTLDSDGTHATHSHF